MKKILLYCFLLLLAYPAMAQEVDEVNAASEGDYYQAIEAFRAEKLKDLLDNERTPFQDKVDRKKLKKRGLNYFDADSNYCFQANFTLLSDPLPIHLDNAAGGQSAYIRYGYLDFTMNGEEVRLTVYRNARYKQMKADYRDHLFLPFGDLSNGESTYGGGRYLDFILPLPDVVELDFNKAYNPWCAYPSTVTYACPFPPSENQLEFSVEVGEKNYK